MKKTTEPKTRENRFDFVAVIVRDDEHTGGVFMATSRKEDDTPELVKMATELAKMKMKFNQQGTVEVKAFFSPDTEHGHASFAETEFRFELTSNHNL